jgi:3-ketosteroid 9alpha-monooxygenase subunit A
MRHRAGHTGYARGWYAVAAVDDLRADTLLPLYWLDLQLVAYRTAAGAAQVADAYCPHLGAHLASHDGAVLNGELTCPFHKWRWDGATGRCSHIPYASALPPGNVRLTLHPTREVDGDVLMWHDPAGGAPDFEPYASPAFRDGGWVLFDRRTVDTTCPFPDIFENLFDSAHIVQLHGARQSPQLTHLSPTPHGLQMEYGVDADAEEAALERIALEFTGITRMSQHYTGRGWEALFFIDLTPLDFETTRQHYRLYLKDLGSAAAHEALGKPFVERFVYEVQQDMKVINFKKHLPTPRLCRADGPIYQYRAYAAQYYPATPCA